MLVNHTIVGQLKKPLDTAIKILTSLSKFNIKVVPSKKSAAANIDSLLIGEYNSLSGGRSNYSADKVLALIKKSQKMPAFPKLVKYKKTSKGHVLFIEIEKIESDGNHDN
jgi:hypothetical protein